MSLIMSLLPTIFQKLKVFEKIKKKNPIALLKNPIATGNQNDVFHHPCLCMKQNFSIHSSPHYGGGHNYQLVIFFSPEPILMKFMYRIFH